MILTGCLYMLFYVQGHCMIRYARWIVWTAGSSRLMFVLHDASRSIYCSTIVVLKSTWLMKIWSFLGVVKITIEWARLYSLPSRCWFITKLSCSIYLAVWSWHAHVRAKVPLKNINFQNIISKYHFHKLIHRINALQSSPPPKKIR